MGYGLAKIKNFRIYEPNFLRQSTASKSVTLPIKTLVTFSPIDNAYTNSLVKFTVVAGQYKDWFSLGELKLITQISPLELLAMQAE